MNEAGQLSIRISCIIPTLGRGKILGNTVRMLLDQSYPAHEIIVVDQTPAPDEETDRALEAWQRRGAIRWLHQAEPNASKARNSGSLAATSDVLLFLDDDIVVGEDFVAAHARNFGEDTALAVAGQILEGDQRVVLELPPAAMHPTIGWIRFPKNYGRRCKTAWMASGNLSIRRDIYLSLGGMDENYKKGAFREESDLAMRFLKAGYQFQFDPEASIFHLGATVVKGGGARSWSSIFKWHHYIGDWYFNLGFLTPSNACRLLWFSFRHLVVSRRNLMRPWLVFLCGACWCVSIPIALILRLRGPKLIPTNSDSSQNTSLRNEQPKRNG